jgi:hypothetical protein
LKQNNFRGVLLGSSQISREEGQTKHESQVKKSCLEIKDKNREIRAGEGNRRQKDGYAGISV